MSYPYYLPVRVEPTTYESKLTVSSQTTPGVPQEVIAQVDNAVSVPPSSLALHVAHASHSWIAHVLFISSIAVAVWDWMSCLLDEYRWIWKRPFTAVSVICEDTSPGLRSSDSTCDRLVDSLRLLHLLGHRHLDLARRSGRRHLPEALPGSSRRHGFRRARWPFLCS
jgi:hypothetical protein